MYAVVKVINGNFFIDSEGFQTLDSAIVKFHDVCKTLWNAPDVIRATVKIVNTDFNMVENYQDFIKHVTNA